jgi:hypothetical protein
VIAGSCHCGAVRIAVVEAPAIVTSCNCSICRRLGTLWAYYRPAQVTLTHAPGATDTYSWDDKSIAFRRCATCGCTTHWESITDPPIDRMGVNARLLDIDLETVEVKYLDGASYPRSTGAR